MREVWFLFLWMALALGPACAPRVWADPHPAILGHTVSFLSQCDEALAEIFESPRSSSHLKLSFLNRTTVLPGDNLHFEQMAMESSPHERLVFHVENAIFKQLKDKILEDGEEAAAATALYKQILMRLIDKNDYVKSHLIARYGDFKTTRLMFDENSVELKSQISEIYLQAADAFELAIAQYPELNHLVEVQQKLNGHAALWHLAGFGAGRGKEADEAALAARAGRYRYDSHQDRIRIQDFEDPAVRALLEHRMTRAEKLRQLIEKEILPMRGWREMLERGSNGGYVLSESMLDLLRSVPAHTLAEYGGIQHMRILQRFGVDVSPELIANMQEYFHCLDALAPSIYIEEEIVDLGISKAHHGLVVVDQRGGGARNLLELAHQLEKLSTDPAVSQTAQFGRAVRASRQGQNKASMRFNGRMAIVSNSVAKALPTKGDEAFGPYGNRKSGDDFIHAPERDLLWAEKLNVVDELARSGIRPGDYRVAWIPSQYKGQRTVRGDLVEIPTHERGKLVETALTMEKELRLAIEGRHSDQITHYELDQMTIGIDLSPHMIEGGEIRVMIAGKVSSEQSEKIAAVMQKVLKAKFAGYHLMDVMVATKRLTDQRVPQSLAPAGIIARWRADASSMAPAMAGSSP